jgi:uncharacterized protein
MSFNIAIKCIDFIFKNIPTDLDEFEIAFIGGEPLLEFDLIKNIYNYAIQKKWLFNRMCGKNNLTK